MNDKEKTIIELKDGEALGLDYNPVTNQAIIRFSANEIRLPIYEMEWLCETFRENYTRKKDGYREKYEKLVSDYVKVTSDFASLLAKGAK